MPDGYGGSGEGAGGGSQGMGGLGNGGNGGNGGVNRGDPAQQQQAAAEARAEARAQAQAAADAASPFAAMSKGFQSTPENQRAIADSAMSAGFRTTPENQQALKDQQTVRDYLSRVEKDKAISRSKPGEEANFGGTNYGTNVTNALDAAKASGVNVQNFTRSFGKNGTEREITSTSTNIPIARFLGYTGDPGSSAISYAEAKMMQSLGAGDMSGVNLNSMTGTGLSVADSSGNPWSGITSENIGQTADGIVASTDFADFADKVFTAVKHFIPGYGLVEGLANLISGKYTLGDIIAGIGVNRLAAITQIPVGLLRPALELNAGDTLSAYMTNAAIMDIAKQNKLSPMVVSIGLSESGALNGLRQVLNPLNVNAGTSRAAADAINTGLQNLGITMGTGQSTGASFNAGDTQQDQIDRYLDSTRSSGGNNSGTSTPDTPAAPAGTSGKTSSANFFGGFGSGSGSSSPNLAAPATSVALPLAAYYKTKQIPNTMYQDQLADFRRIQQADDPNANVYALREAPAQGANKANSPYSYGKETPIEDILNPEDNPADALAGIPDYLFPTDGSGVPDYMKTSVDYANNYGLNDYSNYGAASGGAIGGTRYGRYARGGLSVPLMAHGGKMRIDFRHGDAVTGAGDGQSDDIPAMLADGEFVFPADVVAAIGNGSTKAGSDKLYDMMHGIRAHARSAKPKDLPPEIKSPLDFLKNTKRKRQGAKHG